MTFRATGALAGDFTLKHNGNSYADISVTLCHSIFQLAPGVGAIYELGTPLYGDTTTWSISTTKLVGGGTPTGAIYMYAVPNFALSNVSWTGGNGGFIRFANTPPGSCFITNATIINNNAASQYMVEDSSGAYNPCAISGMALETDPAGAHNQGLTGIATNISDSLLYNYYDLHGVTGNMLGIGANGNASNINRGVITHNAIYGGNLYGSDFTDSSNNILFVNKRSAPSQGGLFIDGHGYPFTSTGDVVAYDLSYGPDPGSVGVTTLSGITPVTVTLRHMTVQMASSGTAGGGGVGLGEISYSVINSELSNSIVVGAFRNIASNATANSFVQSGTGGVGVFNNNSYNSPNAYTNFSGLVHFDNGVTPHDNGATVHTTPVPPYGDTNFNPNFVSTTRGFAACDSTLGGTGSVAHMFETVMFNRWTGAAPAYTPSQVVECLRCAWLPTNAAFKTAGSTGGYIGAVSPEECACH